MTKIFTLILFTIALVAAENATKFSTQACTARTIEKAGDGAACYNADSTTNNPTCDSSVAEVVEVTTLDGASRRVLQTLQCHNHNDNAEKKCVKTYTLGKDAKCSKGWMCASGICVNSKCTDPALVVAPDGADKDCRGICAGAFYCDKKIATWVADNLIAGTATVASAKCKAVKEAGTACSDTYSGRSAVNGQCADGHYCKKSTALSASGTCRAFKALTESCHTNQGAHQDKCDPALDAWCPHGGDNQDKCTAKSNAGEYCETASVAINWGCAANLWCPLDANAPTDKKGKCQNAGGDTDYCEPLKTKSCGDGFYCVATGLQSTPTDWAKTCRPLGGVDAWCNVDAQCQQGKYCAPANPPGKVADWDTAWKYKCKDPGAAGTWCNGNAHCSGGNWCPNDAATQDGDGNSQQYKCFAPQGEGGKCETDNLLSCQDGFWCKATAAAGDAQAGICTAPAATDAACDTFWTDARSCANGGYCQIGTKLCRAWVADGGDCNGMTAANSKACTSGLHCPATGTRTCRGYVAEGGECDSPTGQKPCEVGATPALACTGSGVKLCQKVGCGVVGQKCYVSGVGNGNRNTVRCACNNDAQVICNDNKGDAGWTWTLLYSLGNDSPASDAQACALNTWYTGGKCMDELVCTNDANCEAASWIDDWMNIQRNSAYGGNDAEGDGIPAAAVTQRLVYCGCADEAGDRKCALSGTIGSCTGDAMKKQANRICPTPTTATAPTRLGKTWSEYTDMVTKAANAQTWYTAASYECISGATVGGTSDPNPPPDNNNGNGNGNGNGGNGNGNGGTGNGGGGGNGEGGIGISANRGVGNTGGGTKCNDASAVAEADGACDENKVCDPTKAKSDKRTVDYGIEVEFIAYLQCIDGKCVMDNTIADGAACKLSSSCTSGMCVGGKCQAPKKKPEAADDDCLTLGCCVGDFVCTAGKCKAAPTPVAEGEACDILDVNKWCDTGLYCPLTGDKKCTKLKADGEACTTQGPDITCESGLCKGSAKTCGKYEEEGAECTGDVLAVLTTDKPCAAGLECKGDPKKCTAPTVPDPPACTATHKADDACTGTSFKCNCDGDAFLCNDKKYIAPMSVAADGKADSLAACQGSLWYDAAGSKCLAEMTCEKNSDCVSPLDSDTTFKQRNVYCDCTEKKCKALSGVEWKCGDSAADVAKKAACESFPVLVAPTAPCANWGDYESYVKAGSKNAAIRQSRNSECILGELISGSPSGGGDSDGAMHLVPALSILLAALFAFFTM